MDQLEHSYFILQMVEVSLHLDLQPFEICASKYLLGKVYAALKVPFLLCWHLEINKLSYSLQGVFPLQQVNFTFSYHLNWLWLFYSIRVSFKSMTEIEHFALRTGVSSLDAVITLLQIHLLLLLQNVMIIPYNHQYAFTLILVQVGNGWASQFHQWLLSWLILWVWKISDHGAASQVFLNWDMGLQRF